MFHESLLVSDALYRLSGNAWSLLRFLVIEHLRHGGKENGRLRAPYDQLVQFGITRRLIRPTIQEVVDRGLLTVERQGFAADGTRLPSLYRLTFLPAYGQPPTNEWRTFQLPRQLQTAKHVSLQNLTNQVPDGKLGCRKNPAKLPQSQVHQGELGSGYPMGNCYLDLDLTMACAMAGGGHAG